MKLRFLAVATALALASPAQATIVFNDDFDTETPGAPAAGLAKWNINGTIDVVAASNPYNITVGLPASGNVIDLDGTPGPGSITTKNDFVFNIGDLVKLSFVMGGSQRVSGSDNFFTRLIFNGGFFSQGISNGQGTGVLSSLTGANGFFGPTTTFNRTVLSNAPFSTSSFSFVATNAGSIRLGFGSTSQDNIGPLLDNVRLDITGAVPEPSTWLMMIAGFGFIGAAMRRKRQPVTASFA